jgi:hypothetical protein
MGPSVKAAKTLTALIKPAPGFIPHNNLKLLRFLLKVNTFLIRIDEESALSRAAPLRLRFNIYVVNYSAHELISNYSYTR